MTGAVLLILLAIECYTILRIGRLLTWHVFLGMLLLGPVTLPCRWLRAVPYRQQARPAITFASTAPALGGVPR
jgi:hypothetical protein